MSGSGEEFPKVSVVIPNYKGAHLLPDCLGSLKEQDWPNLEVMVADNGSSDESAQIAAHFDVRFLPLEKNYGYSIANNRAASTCTGDFLFFLNNDTRLDSSVISCLMKVALSDETLFVADPKVMDWEGQKVIHHPFHFAKGPFFRSRFPWIRCAGNPPVTMEIPWGCGSSLLVRRWMFEALGGFDETFFFDWEDTDLCWRAWMRGWKTTYVSAALVYHKQAATFKAVHKDRPPDWAVLRAQDGQKNYLRFVLKVMPTGMITQVVLRELCRLAKSILTADVNMSLVQAKAFFKTIVTLPDILRQRARIQREAVTDSASILKGFLKAG